MTTTEMAAATEVWIAIPCSHSAASSWAMRTAPSTAALRSVARSRATRRLQGTPQTRSQARATLPGGGAALLLLAEGPPLWADSTLLLGSDHRRSRRRGLALDFQATAVKSPKVAAPG